LRHGLGIVAAASVLATGRLVGLYNLALGAAIAGRLAAFLGLNHVGVIDASGLGALRPGGLLDSAVLAAVAYGLAAFQCLGLVEEPGTSHPGAFIFGGLADLGIIAAPARRRLEAVPVSLVVRGVVAALCRASLAHALAFGIFRCQAVIAVAGAIEELGLGAALGRTGSTERRGILV
jgi:hypothetical protein